MIDTGRVVVISPHLDDGILSCGQLLVASDNPYVVTVFTGMPHRWVTTPYDEGCGFETSAAAVKARRVEDHNACSAVGARWFHCDQLDIQYRDDAPPTGVVGELCAAIPGDLCVVAPLGLCHPDHVAVSDAALSCGFDNLWLYEELPYRVAVPEAAHARLAQLDHFGVKLEQDTQPAGDLTVKQQAARCYQSQLHSLGDLGNEHSWLVPERYWRVVR
jgi:LmbE family N-acetylglucosaminyl deacetylase